MDSLDDNDFERIEFWAPKKIPALGENSGIEDPYLCVHVCDGIPLVSFVAFPDEGHEGLAEWTFQQPLRELLQYWVGMHENGDGQLVISDPEARLLTKLILAYDEWESEERKRA